MKRRNATRNALLMSVLSMLLCVSMLVGTTFAWFTDSVTSANNIIKSGNLDIELEYWNGTEWVDVEDKSDILTNDLWEPGVTEVAYFRLANVGSLALKYQFGINIQSEKAGVNKAGETFNLSDHIKFGVVENITVDASSKTPTVYAKREDAVAALTSAKKLNEGFTKADSMLAGAEDLYLALVVYMPTTVGNEANHKTSEDATDPDKYRPEINLGINVLATQYTHESDSFGNQYDKDASVVLANNEEELLDAIDAVAGTVATIQVAAGEYTFPASKLKDGMTLECAPGTVFEGNSKLNIDGATVVGATFSNPGGTAADQTINGTFRDCTFTGKNGLRWCYAGDTVVFENCVFSGELYGVHFDGGANNVVFKNCTFSGFNTMGGEIELATFEGCTFKANDRSGYNGINLWGSTVMTDCTFVFDCSKTEWVDLCGDNKTATFTNCVVTDGTNETPIKDVVGDSGDGNTIIIDGVTKN